LAIAFGATSCNKTAETTTDTTVTETDGVVDSMAVEPGNDTATVVRTDSNAVQETKAAADKAADATKDAAHDATHSDAHPKEGHSAGDGHGH